MAQQGKLLHAGEVFLSDVTWCDGFLCKLAGLMLRRELRPGEGLLMAYNRPSRTNTTIHMFFMRFPIAVFWLDGDLHVVDKTHADPWRPAYAPAQPAQIVLETFPEKLDVLSVGDALVFDPC
ncbi:MAG: DUF192 domain-containing protein [Anaerolineae bacterium]